MERLIWESGNVSNAAVIERACRVLAEGGVILYPTDTVYGLGADATNAASIAKINIVKQRREQKPQLILVSDMAMAERYGYIPDIAKVLTETFWPGPLTILARNISSLPDILTTGSSMVGIRVPNHTFCRQVVRMLDRPITSTSANISEQPQASTLEGILAHLSEHQEKIDLVIQEEEEHVPRTPSTLVRFEGDCVVVVREGTITRQAIDQVMANRL